MEACSRETREQAQILTNFFEGNFLEQYVDIPTRQNNILDIFATNDHELVANIEIENTDQRTSDHKMVLIRTRICLLPDSEDQDTSPENLLTTLNFWSSEINWQLIKDKFESTNWQEVLGDQDIDNRASKLLKHLEETCVEFVPPKVQKKKNIIPRDRRTLMRKRKNLRSKLLKTRNPLVINNLEQALEKIERNLITSHELQREREEAAVRKIIEDPKYFFNYARSKSKIKSPIGPLIQNNTTVSDCQAMYEILKNQFESVFNTQSSEVNMEELLKDQGPRTPQC